MNWFYIPVLNNIKIPITTSPWPGILGALTSFPVGINLFNTRTGYSLIGMDLTHAIIAYPSTFGTQLLAKSLSVSGTNITIGTNVLIDNGIGTALDTQLIKMSSTQFIVNSIQITNTNDVFVGGFSGGILSNSHGSLQSSNINISHTYPINSGKFLTTYSNGTITSARLFNIVGTTISVTGTQQSNLFGAVSTHDYSGNGTYFAEIGEGISALPSVATFIIYYYNGTDIITIEDSTPVSGIAPNSAGTTIHVLSNNLCAVRFTVSGDNLAQHISLFQLTPAGAIFIKNIRISINNKIFKFFSEGNILYALTTLDLTANVTQLSIMSFNVSTTDIIYTGLFTLPPMVTSSQNSPNNVNITKISTNKWLYEFMDASFPAANSAALYIITA